MGGAKVFVWALATLGCWGLLAGAPNASRAAALPVLSLTDQLAPAGAGRRGRYGGLLHDVQSYQGLNAITDEATGIRLGIPNDLVGPPADTSNGREWNAPGRGRRLSINTLRYKGRSLDELRATLSKRSGRTISMDRTVPGGFILEGSEDKGATALYVEVRSHGGELRCLSIVHSTRYRAELAPVIEAVKKSFEPFPAPRPVVEPAGPVASAVGPTDARVPELLKKLAEAEEREREAKRLAEEAKRQAQEAKQREDKAQQEEAEKRTRERELADWKEEVIKEAHRKAWERLLAELAKVGEKGRIERAKTDPEAGNPDGPTLPGLPQGKRVALVVGVEAYAHLTRLLTAHNDAAGMAATLRGRGFSVIEALDVDRRGFYEKWSQFLREIEPGGTVVYFFAGHGIQIEGRNFLLPTDAPDASVAVEMAREMAVNFNALREDVERRSPGLSLFILDACRDNPYVRTRGLTRGLARVDVQSGSGTFVMYSAAEGQLALDRLPSEGAGANSVYVRTLLPWLKQENITLQEIAAYVHNDVKALAAKIGHKQAPHYDSGIGPICWSGRCPARTVQK
jgi:Caspase domain